MKVASLNLPVQRIIEALVPEARERLDKVLEKIGKKENLGSRSIYFEASKSDFPSIEGITSLKAVKHQNTKTLQFQIRFLNDHVWKNNKLKLLGEFPESMLVGMKSKNFTDVVDHPIFEGMTILKAEKFEKSADIYAKIIPGVDVATIKSCGVPREQEDLFKVLKEMGVEKACRVFEAFVREDKFIRNGRTLQNIARKLKDGKREVDLLAQDVRRPTSCESLWVEVQKDKIVVRASFTSGCYWGETLYLHGQRRSKQTITGNYLFRMFSYKDGVARKMRNPTVPLEAIFA